MLFLALYLEHALLEIYLFIWRWFMWRQVWSLSYDHGAFIFACILEMSKT